MIRPRHLVHEGRRVADEFLAGFTVETLLSDTRAAAISVSDAHATIAETDWADPADAFSVHSYLTRLQSSLPTSHQLGMCQITDLGRPVLAVAAPDGTWTICVPGVGAAVSVDLAGAAVAAWELVERTTSDQGQPRDRTGFAAQPGSPVVLVSGLAPSDEEGNAMLTENQAVAADVPTEWEDPGAAVNGIIGVDGASPAEHLQSDRQRIAEVLAYLDHEAQRWSRTSAVGEICQAVGTRLLGRKHHWHPGDR